MNALEFVANVEWVYDWVRYGDETCARLPRKGNEMTYLYMSKNIDSYRYYEYLNLTEKEGDTGKHFFYILGEVINKFPVQEQLEILRKMEKIEVDIELEITGYGDMAIEDCPLFSVRGTCGMEKGCKREKECAEISLKPCCRNKVVGFSALATKREPVYGEVFMDLILWMIRCPNLDVLYIMHDLPPCALHSNSLFFRSSFLIKNNKIRLIEDYEEMKKLYNEYHKKYRCSTKDVEDEMNDWFTYGDIPDFHF